MKAQVRTILVRSRSQPGSAHRVQLRNGRPQQCSCPGFLYQRTCSHLDDADRIVWPTIKPGRDAP